ncbi:PaaI family thioesterase [Elioraea rosea]|uniref:PaaI family thioesterase n=1 Tax=Elioraea rosea TaxID=2492390 RepID=UPI001182732B|nr:PaaI family thioesterase [Elioraea rosea]
MTPRDPGWEARVRDSFARQAFTAMLGARMTALAPGRCEITLERRDDLLQQHGFVHGGAVATLADTACGYAAFTLFAAEASILTVEMKVNFMSPADGEVIVARAEVKRSGGTLTVVSADLFAVREGKESLAATALATMMALEGRADAPKERPR